MLSLLSLASSYRELPFLSIVRNFFRENPDEASQWIGQFDPNILRRHDVDLRPLYVDVVDLFGAKYRVDVNDHIGWNLFLRGFFDPIPTLVAKHFSKINKGATYVDVGCNVGSTCIPLALSGVEVLAIDASAATCSDFMKNISLNDGVAIIAVNAAIVSPSQLRGGRFVPLYRSEGNFGAGSLFENWNVASRGTSTELAPCVTMDSLIYSYNVRKISLLKLDIEGYETFALEGFQQTLENTHPPVLLEWRPDHLIKVLGKIDDFRPLFPSGYAFFAVSYKVEIKHFPFGLINDVSFFLRLDKVDLGQINENVLAIHLDDVERYQLTRFFGAFCLVQEQME